jgi:hypothetical protein
MILVIPLLALGQDDEEEDYYYNLVFPQDSVEVNQRHFDTLELHAYKTNPEYNYENDPKYDSDLWGYIKGLISSFIRNLLGDKGADTFWNMFEYALVIMGVIFLLYALARLNRSPVFQKESKDREFDLEEIDEDSSDEKLESILKIALEQSNFRVAVRVQFLKILKLLDQHQIIIWKDFKTNADFASEIESSSLKESFKELRWVYENIWYGEFAINQDYYNKFEIDVNRFNDHIKAT